MRMAVGELGMSGGLAEGRSRRCLDGRVAASSAALLACCFELSACGGPRPTGLSGFVEGRPFVAVDVGARAAASTGPDTFSTVELAVTDTPGGACLLESSFRLPPDARRL